MRNGLRLLALPTVVISRVTSTVLLLPGSSALLSPSVLDWLLSTPVGDRDVSLVHSVVLSPGRSRVPLAIVSPRLLASCSRRSPPILRRSCSFGTGDRVSAPPLDVNSITPNVAVLPVWALVLKVMYTFVSTLSFCVFSSFLPFLLFPSLLPLYSYRGLSGSL